MSRYLMLQSNEQIVELYLGHKQPVAVTVSKYSAYSVDPESCLSITFGIKLNELHALVGYRCYERDVVVLRHLVIDGHIVLILYPLHADLMLFITFFSFA